MTELCPSTESLGAIIAKATQHAHCAAIRYVFVNCPRAVAIIIVTFRPRLINVVSRRFASEPLYYCLNFGFQLVGRRPITFHSICTVQYTGQNECDVQ